MADSARTNLDDFWVQWVDITQEEVNDFRSALEAAPNEAAMQAFLEANPKFLCQHLPAARGYWVIPTKRLGSEHITDFLIGENTPHQPTWHAVEIERPQALLFTRRGDPSAPLTHAMRQIDDWRSWLSRNRDYASRAAELSGLGLGDIDPELDGLVIIGRAGSLSPAVEERRRRLARQNRIRIEPYDWLLSQAEERTRPPANPAFSLDFLFRRDEFHDMRAERAIESVFGGAQSADVTLSATRSISYESLILDDQLDDDSGEPGTEVIYKAILASGTESTSTLGLDDWRDWLNAAEMELVDNLTLLATEIEPTSQLTDSLRSVSSGLWVGDHSRNESVLRVNFLLYLPLDLPFPEKEERCRSAKTLMESLEIPPPAIGWSVILSGASGTAMLRLRAWRDATAEAQGLPPYVVFVDSTLRLIAHRMPTTLDELRSLGGISDSKIEKYGEGVLRALAAND